MSNGRNSSHTSLPKSEVSKNINLTPKSRTAPPSILPLSRLLNSIQIITSFVTRILSRFSQQVASKLASSIKSSTIIAAIVAAVVVAGHTLSAQLVVAQTPPLAPLNRVPVPEPNNIGNFIKNKTAAIALGKSLFWDMQLGTDGIQACASCHFHAGADNRAKNQINPKNDAFNIGGGANYQLTVADYPFHKLTDPNNISASVVSDSNDVTGSQGVFRSKFNDVVPGSAQDHVTPLKDTVFNVQDTNVRQVTARNSPSVINAVFNFRNFWDGRAQDIFNGVNEFGLRDPHALVLKATNQTRLEDVQVRLNNSSLASQAVGPPLASVETFAENPVPAPFAPLVADLEVADNTVKITDATTGEVVNIISNDDIAESTAVVSDSAIGSKRPPSTPITPLKRFGRKLGKKLLAVQPLAKQIVAYDDSILGILSNSTSSSPKTGLKKTYKALIQEAFQPQWWKSKLVIQVDPKTGERLFYRQPKNRPLSTIEYTLPEYNFSLFFGLAVQAYEATLISDLTPFDQFLGGQSSALTQQQQRGQQIFQNQGLCIGCHIGSELTSASVSRVTSVGRIGRIPIPPNFPAQDTGFFNIGVRPQQEDLGLGGNDAFNNSLSEVRLAQIGKFPQIFGAAPPTLNPPLSASENALADAAFKTPGLRNVELTAPYFHNGGQLTLRQVVDFYNRGGDFRSSSNILPPLNLSEAQKEDLVAFLRGLTDERVRYQQAPFDHPQLFVPNGHPGDDNAVVVNYNLPTTDATKQAADSLLEIPAVGRNGGSPLENFLGYHPHN